MKTQPGRVHALPNLHGFVPAPGIVEGSTTAPDGAFGVGFVGGAADAAVDDAGPDGAFFCAFETCDFGQSWESGKGRFV